MVRLSHAGKVKRPLRFLILLNNSVYHTYRAVGGAGKLLVVRYNEECLIKSVAQLKKEPVQLLFIAAVEAARWFIGKYYIGTIYKSASHRHTLVLASRHLGWLVMSALGKPHKSKQLHRLFCSL